MKSSVEWNKSRRKPIKEQKGMTKEKALFLGLLLSDGSESIKANNITLARLDKFTENFAYNLVKDIYGLTGKKDKKRRRIIWYSENMRDDLHKYVSTIVHSPTTKVNTPEIIMNNKQFAKLFLKGYFRNK